MSNQQDSKQSSPEVQSNQTAQSSSNNQETFIAPQEADSSEVNTQETGNQQEIDNQTTSQPEVDNLEPEVTELGVIDLQEKLQVVENQWKRSVAELSNYRRNHENERANMHRRSTANVLKEFLSPIDNLNRAMLSIEKLFTDPEVGSESTADKETFVESLIESLKGLQLVKKSFEDTLIKMNAKPVAQVGDVLNPQFHLAVSTVASKGEPDRIIDVLEQGYEIGGQIVRQAIVSASIPYPDAPESSSEPSSESTSEADKSSNNAPEGQAKADPQANDNQNKPSASS